MEFWYHGVLKIGEHGKRNIDFVLIPNQLFLHKTIRCFVKECKLVC